MEILVYILSDLIHILKFFLLCDMFLVLKKRNINCKIYIIPILTISTSVIMFYTDNAHLMMLEYLLFVFVLIEIAYKESSVKALIVSIWLIFLLSLIDLMSETLVDAIFIILDLNNKNALQIITQIVTVLIISIVGMLLQKKHKEGIKTVTNPYLVCYSFLIIINATIFVYLKNFVLTDVQINHKVVLEIVFILVIIGVFVQMAMTILFMVSRNIYKEKEEIAEKYLNEQKEHYEYLEAREAETKKFRHDMRGHLHILAMYCQEHEFEKIGEYLERMNCSIDSFGNKISVNNSIVDAILNKYLTVAENSGIRLHVTGHFPVTCNISAYDLCIIFSNLLDNAMEAERNCNGKEITFTCRYTEQEIIVIVENDYDGKIIIENGKIQTKKKDRMNHGLGLENVAECVSRNNGYMSITTEDNRFRVMLSLKNS